MNIEQRIAFPNCVSGELQAIDEKVKSLMEKTNLAPKGSQLAIFAKCVERRELELPSETTLSPTILKGSPFPVISVERSSDQD